MTDGGEKTAPWFVYILSCNDGTLYTGITTDLDRRVGEHNTGKAGARYTRSRRPVRLVYREAAENRSEAARREYRIRRLPASGKRSLVESAVGHEERLARKNGSSR